MLSGLICVPDYLRSFISDGFRIRCGATHKSAAEHGGKQMSARECTLACVKNGAKYVFVRSGKVYNIDNQDYSGLQEHAGHSVRLTGEMKGDTITVSKIDMSGKKK